MGDAEVDRAAVDRSDEWAPMKHDRSRVGVDASAQTDYECRVARRRESTENHSIHRMRARQATMVLRSLHGPIDTDRLTRRSVTMCAHLIRVATTASPIVFGPEHDRG